MFECEHQLTSTSRKQKKWNGDIRKDSSFRKTYVSTSTHAVAVANTVTLYHLAVCCLCFLRLLFCVKIGENQGKEKLQTRYFQVGRECTDKKEKPVGIFPNILVCFIGFWQSVLSERRNRMDSHLSIKR